MRGLRLVAGALALVAVTACASDRAPAARAGATASAASCRSGTVHLRTVDRESVLAYLSPVVTVDEADAHDARYQRFEFPKARVRTLTASVETAVPGVPVGRVLSSLADRLRVDRERLAEPGRKSALRSADRDRVDLRGVAGRFVEADAVDLVTAGFTVTCSGRRDPVHGSAVTWTPGLSGALLRCGVRPGKAAWVREAYRLACGATP